MPRQLTIFLSSLLIFGMFQLGCQVRAQSSQTIANSIGMQLNRIPSGKFTMGEVSEAHEVTLTQPFFLGIHEVTQSQYEKVMGVNPSRDKGDNNPVESVSWDEAVEFCRRLSELPAEMAARRIYRLPTEAEWEYSCRAGTTTDFSFGNDESQLGEYAWYAVKFGVGTHPVGQKKLNSWGLYDMHGNVWEWCQDWAGDYTSGTVSDPSGPTTGSNRVTRGGSWGNYASLCRSAYRSGSAPDFRVRSLGFRVALVPGSK